MITHVTHDKEGNVLARKITKIEPRFHGHLHLTFEDGSHDLVLRGNHEARELKVGDLVKVHEGQVEVCNAVDAKASEETLVERESADERAADEDEREAAREPEARPRSKRK